MTFRPWRTSARLTPISGATSDLVLDLSHEGNATFTADKGRISDNKLTLSAAEAANFTLTVSTK